MLKKLFISFSYVKYMVVYKKLCFYVVMRIDGRVRKDYVR